jgi:hypothetical protein
MENRVESVFGSQEVSQQFKANVERAQALAQSRRAGLSYVEIVRIIVSGLPGDAQSAGDDFISIIEHAAREGFLRVEGVSITPSGNPIPFPENIHFCRS